MAIGAIIGGISALAPTVSRLFTNNEDPRRFQEADRWYAQAVAGNTDALCALKHMGGLRGCNQCGAFGNRCGFATDAAKKYAEQLYQQAEKVLAGGTAMATPTPQPGSSLGAIADFFGQTSQVTGAVAGTLTGAQQATDAQVRLQGALQWGKVALVVGGVGLLALLVFRARR